MKPLDEKAAECSAKFATKAVTIKRKGYITTANS
jgi:hypothetical protein